MLTLPRLVARNLAYHRRGNAAVLLGVAVGSAVLTGALLVGDSLRGSLRARVERQLSGIDAVAMFPRLVRDDIAKDLPGNPAGVLMLPGSVQTASNDPATARFLGRVTVLGVGNTFRPAGVPDGAVNWEGRAKAGGVPPVVLSARVAAKLEAEAGDRVRLGVERVTEIPRDSSLAERSAAAVTATEEFEVAAVLPPDSPANDFNLTPNPAAPLNVFVPISAASRLVTGSASPKVNAVLARGGTPGELNAALRSRLGPEDFGLREPRLRRSKYLSIEYDQLVFPPALADGVVKAAAAAGLRAEPTVIYIADTLAAGGTEIPYPVVCGLNPNAEAPLGRFLPEGVSALGDREIVLLRWPGSDLNGLAAGSEIRVAYYDPEVEGVGLLKEAKLTLKGYLPLAGVARDPYLTPEIKGVTDGANLHNWDRPPVLPKDKIEARVPRKPKRHPRAAFDDLNKATPMAYVNLATAKELFGSRYGAVTSVRVAGPVGGSLDPDQVADRLYPVLPKHLDPAAAGFTFDPIRDRLLTASKGGTDFGGLFLGFSLFLIVAALMLVGLLFRLALDRRAKEVGLLLATGYSVRQVRRMLLAEGLALATIGALLGLALGVAYNRLLLRVLLELWPDPEVANVLRPHATPLSFAIGFGATVFMSLLALWLSVRGLVRLSPPSLLRGETAAPKLTTATGSPIARLLFVACVPLGIALVIAGKFVSNPDFQAMTFFAGGGLLLTAGLAAGWAWMKWTRHGVVNGRGPAALGQLGARNAARNPSRSLLTAALLAAAAFLLVAVESFRRQPGGEFLDKTGGSGGFNLIAESDIPLFDSFGSGPGRADLERQLKKAFAPPDVADPPETPGYLAAKAELRNLEEVFAVRLRDGDDASCMNLAQATRPRVLGVPRELIDRGGFKFYATEANTPEEKNNPWLLLTNGEPGGPIPVFCEQNTAQWMLKKAVGDEVTMPGDDGRDVAFRIVGTFADSPFQSELVASAEAFERAFPKTAGFRVFLARTAAGKEEAVGRVLSTALRANGLIATPTKERVAAYQAVIGAYLSTFQLLGGLGLLLGVLGLAIVVLRGVWERVGELALLRAVGYRTRQLQFLVLAENALLLVAGLLMGVVAALISVAPHVAAGADVPWGRLAAILGAVFVVGLGVAFAATAGILRVPVIPALRRE